MCLPLFFREFVLSDKKLLMLWFFFRFAFLFLHVTESTDTYIWCMCLLYTRENTNKSKTQKKERRTPVRCYNNNNIDTRVYLVVWFIWMEYLWNWHCCCLCMRSLFRRVYTQRTNNRKKKGFSLKSHFSVLCLCIPYRNGTTCVFFA